MNNELHTYLKRAGEKLSLSVEEREQMRRTVHAYMEMKPLREASVVGSQKYRIQWFFSPRPIAAALVMVLFVSTTGVSYAAQGALPGDLLYPIKTHVNEPVSGALASSASAKTAWAMKVAGERIKEAATLAAEGRLSSTTQQEIQTNFEEHAQQAINSIAQEASTSPEIGTETAVRFEAQLSEYGRILAQVGVVKNVPTSGLTSSIKTKQGQVVTVRMQAKRHAKDAPAISASTEDIAASRTRDAAKKQLSASVRLARDVSDALASSSADSIAVQLQDASTTISVGEEFLGKDSASEALGRFQSALSATEKLNVFLQTSAAINKRTGLLIGGPDKETQTTANPERGSLNESGRGDIENDRIDKGR